MSLNIYVYQVSDKEYGAGYDRVVCESHGNIVEKWPVNSYEEATFAESHGSNYGSVSQRVDFLARAARELLIDEDGPKKPILIDSEDWKYLVEQKELKLRGKWEDALARVRSEKRVATAKVREKFRDEVEGIREQRDSNINTMQEQCDAKVNELLKDCNAKVDGLLDGLTNRGFFKRVALAFRIVFQRKT